MNCDEAFDTDGYVISDQVPQFTILILSVLKPQISSVTVHCSSRQETHLLTSTIK